MSEVVFPQGFLWGTATSAHQVEGHNTNNDWWAWEQAGRVKTPSGAACDQYHRFRDDFDLAKSLHHNAHRFSIEWSRIELREGEFDPQAIAHYRDVLAALRERGLEPVVTLHHYTNPIWLADQGGWTNPKVVDYFTRFVHHVVEELGSQVRIWLTINEPLVYMWMHYLDGTGPPGAHDLGQAMQALEHLVRAHVAAYHEIHRVATQHGWPAQVTIAMHAQPFTPCRWWHPVDQFIARVSTRVYNHQFLEAVMDGRLRLPGRPPVRLPDAHDTLDIIGMNFYGRVFMRFVPTSGGWPGIRCSTRHHREVTERNFLEWDVHPPTLLTVLRWAKPYGKPILITENGICTTDDRQRERFILRHLAVVGQALQEGLPVMGYLYWSLLDNFEWADGYGPRFGLIEVDYATQARRVRDSATRYAEICRTNRLVCEDV